MCLSLKHFDHIVRVFVDDYNAYRPHHGMGNQVLDSANRPKRQLAQHNESIGSIGCRSELGELLKQYYRQAS